MPKNKIELSRLLLRALIFATVAFIIVNSMFPPELSEEQSDAVGGFLSQIIPADTPLGAFIFDNLRKIAHFMEYGLLGAEIAVYVLISGDKFRLKQALLSLTVGPALGFVDETVQIFSGRGPAIVDVWIDIGGFVFFSMCVYVAVALFVTLKKHL